MNDSGVSRSVSGANEAWTSCSSKIPKNEVVYFCQVILIYAIAVTCLINLSLGDKENNSLWWSLLSGCVGYILPSPRIEKRKDEPILHDPTQQQFSGVLS
jgi:hypothetical protein